MEVQRSWWSRNWVWFVPTVIGVPILLCAGVCGGLLYFGLGAFKQTQPYMAGFQAVQSHPGALAVLGSPVESGTLVQGNISIQNDTGAVDFMIPVSGPKGSGAIKIKGTMSGGQWIYSEITLVPDDGSPAIDLRAAVGPLGKAPAPSP
jgi:hypothetical protein